MGDVVGVVAAAVCLLALIGASNILCWIGMHRHRADRPWHWTAVVGSFAYYPWLNRQERIARDAESAARCAKAERLLTEVNTRAARITDHARPSLPALQRAMEQIITASFRAGYDIGVAQRDPQTIEPVIEWRGSTPQITGYRRAS